MKTRESYLVERTNQNFRKYCKIPIQVVKTPDVFDLMYLLLYLNSQSIHGAIMELDSKSVHPQLEVHIPISSRFYNSISRNSTKPTRNPQKHLRTPN